SINLTSAQSPYLINGDITINNEAVVTVLGQVKIVATNNISIQNNVILGDNLMIVAGGEIDVGNNVQIGCSGNWFSRGLINVGNNFDIGGLLEGEGVAFLSQADIHLGNLAVNSGKFNGLIFCEGSFVQTGNNFRFEGSVLAGLMGQVGNNATLISNPNLTDYTNVPGITENITAEASVELINWNELY
ncbi:MAG: hypothetical protein KJ811_05440, partial [Candidatus Margulisbacteria bacterium]|nr:hypothetical protein [Candidatus Margulisiibacteriota bacterium]